MQLPSELTARAIQVPSDADPLGFAMLGSSQALLLAAPDEDGNAWLGELSTDARGVRRARLLPLPGSGSAWVEERLSALAAGDPEALAPRHAVAGGARAARWSRERRAAVELCAWTPDLDARELEESLGAGQHQERGTFYTHPAEVEFAARAAVLELLKHRLEVPAGSPGELAIAELVMGGSERRLDPTLAASMHGTLAPLCILDSSCGAGSFLVGTLLVLEELIATTAHRARLPHDRRQVLASLAANSRGLDVEERALAMARKRIDDLTGAAPTLTLADALLSAPVPADLVVGNPPYVRQELIASPQGSKQVSAADYKSALRELARDRGWHTSQRADLYVYFAHLALDCVKPGGAAALVVSASWLDLDMGQSLRARLTRAGMLRGIHESRSARSFASADVNTVVLVAGRSASSSAGERARFVHWNVSFEEGLTPVDLAKLVTAATDTATSEARVRVVELATLDPELGWGGTYLRAPDVYTRLRAAPTLVPLEELANVRFGLKTGANGFFHVGDADAARCGLAARWLQPILTSARECPGYLTSSSARRRRLLSCGTADIAAARADPALMAYVRTAEGEGVMLRKSVSARDPWWSLGDREAAAALLPRRIGERFTVFENDAAMIEDNNLFGITPRKGVEAELLLATLNSSWFRLALELSSRPLTGAQAVIDTNVYLVRQLPVPDLRRLTPEVAARLRAAWQGLRECSAGPLEREVMSPERHALDDAVLAAFGIPAEDYTSVRNEIYAALMELVGARVAKATTVPG